MPAYLRLLLPPFLLVAAVAIQDAPPSPPPAEQDAGQTPESPETQGPAEQAVQYSQERHVEFLDETFPFDPERPAEGFWHGNIETEIGDVAGSFVVDYDENAPAGTNPWNVRATFAQVAHPNQPVNDVEIDGREIAFDFPFLIDLPDVISEFEFDGEITEDGQFYVGEMTWERLRQPAPFKFQRMPRTMDLENPIAYAGQIEFEEEIAFDITLVFAETPGGNWIGHIDIPAQRVAYWPLVNVRREGDEVVAEMGSRSPATYTGRIIDDGARYAGTYTQGPLELPFGFARVENYEVPDVEPVELRPPYRDEEVSFQAGDTTLQGTLALPDGEGPFAAAVLVAGRSQHGLFDRDLTLGEHRFFFELADDFARRGIATLRFEPTPPAEGAETAPQPTAAELAEYTEAALNYLRGREEIVEGEVGLIGHAEGGLAATLVAAENPDAVDFLALLSAPGLPGMEAELIQTRRKLESDGATPEQIEAITSAQEAMLRTFAAGADREEQAAATRAYIEAHVAADPRIPATSVPVLADRLVARMRSPWVSFLLETDPAAALARVEAPIYVATGSLDTQLAVDANVEAMMEAIENHDEPVDGVPRLTARRFEGLNHYFQRAETGDPAEYARLQTTWDPGFLLDLIGWVRRVTSPAPAETADDAADRPEPAADPDENDPTP